MDDNTLDFLNFFLIPETKNDFPPPASATADGILALGSNLNFDTLLKAYRMGTFPWYNPGELITWHHPDPRFVLFPQNVRVSHSMKKVLTRKEFEFKTDQNFTAVIRNCRTAKRNHEGTWISDEIENAYTNLFNKGYAHCAEAWQNSELVGGLYGVRMGKVFFGESMFAHKSNASKFAFIKMAEWLKNNGVELIDCQVYTEHLESLGASFVSRDHFISLLKKWIP